MQKQVPTYYVHKTSTHEYVHVQLSVHFYAREKWLFPAAPPAVAYRTAGGGTAGGDVTGAGSGYAINVAVVVVEGIS